MNPDTTLVLTGGGPDDGVHLWEPIQLDPPRETLSAPRYWGLQGSEAEFVLDRIANQGSASVQVSFDGGFVEEVSQHRFSSVHKAFEKCRDH